MNSALIRADAYEKSVKLPATLLFMVQASVRDGTARHRPLEELK